jgi:hypothetical protein
MNSQNYYISFTTHRALHASLVKENNQLILAIVGRRYRGK